MKRLFLFSYLMLIFNVLNAQTDSLSHYTLAQLDSIYQTKKKPQEQLPYALAMLQKGEKELDTKDTSYAVLLYEIGVVCQKIKNYPKATIYLNQAIEIQAQKIPNSAILANSLYTLGLVYYHQNQRSEVEKYWQRVLSIRKEALGEKHSDYASVMGNLGNLYHQMGDYKKAEPLYLEASNIKKEAKGELSVDYALSLNSLGVFNYDLAKYAIAEKYYLEAARIWKTVLGEKHIDNAIALTNLGNLYLEIGQYTKAENCLSQASELRKENLGEITAEYANSLNNLAGVFFKRGDYPAAQKLYYQALSLWKEIEGEDNLNYAATLNNLGILHNTLGNYTQVEDYYLQSLKIKEKILGKKHASYSATLNNLASLYRLIGQTEKAESLYLLSLEIKKEALGEKHAEYASTLNNLGSLYKTAEHYEKAEKNYLQCLEIYSEIYGEKNRNTASTLHNLSALYVDLKDYEKAESAVLRALQINKEIVGEKHPSYINNLSVLGTVYLETGNKKAAKDLFIKVLQTEKDNLGENSLPYMRSLNKLGNFYSVSKDDAQAQLCFSESFQISLHYLTSIGSTLGEQDKQEFLNALTNKMNAFNSFAAFHRTHDSLLTLVQNGLLYSKGFSLTGVSEILPLVKSLNNQVLSEIYNDWTYTKKCLNSAYSMTIEERTKKGIRIDSIENLVAEKESMLMKNSSMLKERLGYHKQNFHYADLVAKTNKNEVVVDFLRFELNKDTAWYYALVTQQGWKYPKYIPLCIESQLLHFNAAAVQPTTENYITKSEWSKDLYDLLIHPLEPYLQGKKIIHWSLVGLMNEIAMNTLKDAKGKMLGEKMKIHQYGSLKDFIVKKQEKENTNTTEQSVLLVGDIVFDLEEKEHIHLTENSNDNSLYAMRSVVADSTRSGTRFAPLKGTKIEVESLGKAFSSQKWRIEQLQQKDALEEKVQEYSGDKTPKVLHFATHGFFIPTPKQGIDNPLLRSGIALAGANRVWMGKPRIEGVEDGLWTAYEIANIDLSPAELVVLSACETAKGQIDRHEGVVGLQRSFKIAGVENMLLSLWQVPDKETVELMEEFYKYYLKGATPSEALRKAQGVMRIKYPEPYYWAAFVLIE